MFNNIINLHDFVVLGEKLRYDGLRRIAGKFIRSKDSRVEDAWQHTQSPPTHWWDIPLVEKRWNRLITGDECIDPYTYVSKKYFNDRTDLQALSLGCGTGNRELKWVKAGKIHSIDAYDLSKERIAFAIAQARKEGLSDRVKYNVANVFDVAIRQGSYVVVLAEGALHHFSPLRQILEKVNSCLKPDGYFIINDFVGPSRFQWTDRQLDIVNGILSVLPSRYRKTWKSEKIKSRVYRPGRFSMFLHDPSEAAESSRILTLMDGMFDVVEMKEYGGTLLQLLFKDIAHNFLSEDDTTTHLLQLCFDIEDELLRSKEIRSDFVFAVCRKRRTQSDT